MPVSSSGPNSQDSLFSAARLDLTNKELAQKCHCAEFSRYYNWPILERSDITLKLINGISGQDNHSIGVLLNRVLGQSQCCSNKPHQYQPAPSVHPDSLLQHLFYTLYLCLGASPPGQPPPWHPVEGRRQNGRLTAGAQPYLSDVLRHVPAPGRLVGLLPQVAPQHILQDIIHRRHREALGRTWGDRG